jgi:hypothetical protein
MNGTSSAKLTPQMVMEAGRRRIEAIAARHGVNSPETLAACERWGAVLDDVSRETIEDAPAPAEDETPTVTVTPQ